MTLTRRTPLKRNGYIVRKRPRRLSRAGADPAFVAWLHTQPCVAREIWHSHICRGRIEQSHLRSMTGMGIKEPDKQSVPMCGSLHRQWEQHTCRFSGWSKLDRFAWMVARIAEVHAAYKLMGGVLV
jgi:hypothetical protein